MQGFESLLLEASAAGIGGDIALQIEAFTAHVRRVAVGFPTKCIMLM